jgi:hypothetical protein
MDAVPPTVAEGCADENNAETTIFPELRFAAGHGVKFPKVRGNTELWLTGTTDYGFVVRCGAQPVEPGDAYTRRKLEYTRLR